MAVAKGKPGNYRATYGRPSRVVGHHGHEFEQDSS